MSEFDDKPIDSPDEDKFGFNALAETIAGSISKMTRPEGTVITINGPWGSGKSSLINLIRHHLCDTIQERELKIVDFKCWWFRGEEALTIAFFRELCSGMEPNEEATKKAISKLGAQLLVKASPLVGGMTNMVAPTAGPVASSLTEFIASFIEQNETVEKLHEEIYEKLQHGSKRYLIIIDDIDRLSPDEAMLIFRLVKSVGGLPNVMYLLAYDRQLAEKIVSERYPSEGPHYLEKIVQASFELPAPSRATLETEFLTRLDNVIKEREYRDGDHFSNLFTEMIAPEIKTPRDLIRILNPLKVTWPAVKGEVDPAEFLCLETLRIRRPKLYATLRANKILLTGSVMEDIGVSARMRLEQGRTAEQYDKIFLESEPQSEHERLRDGLMQLFPELERAWKNVDQINLPPDRDGQRRVCAPRHFDTYFRFSLSEDLISKREIEPLIQKAGDFDYIRGSFLAANEISQPNGSSKATHLLYELAIRTDDISDDLIGDLLKSIYSIADRLIEKEGSDTAAPLRQLNQITNTLIIGRLPFDNRSDVLRTACEQATLGYLVRIATSAYNRHFPLHGNQPKPQAECLTTKEHAKELKDLALERIHKAVSDGSLIDCPLLDSVLVLWLRFDEKGVKSWISEMTDDNTAVARLAKAFIGLIEEDLFPDHGTLPATALRGKLGHVVDLDEFSSHVDRAMSEGNLKGKDIKALKMFLEAWRRQENRNDNAKDE